MIFREAAKKAGLFKKDFAALVVIAPESEDDFAFELSQAGGALMSWHTTRGDRAKDILFTIVCNEPLASRVKDMIVSAFVCTPEFVELLQSIDVDVHIVDEHETVIAEFGIRLPK